MKIKIDHIARIEGHSGFVGKIIEGDVSEARMEISQGARLIEGILVGRKIEDVPKIVSRICGICPVVHTLTALKALENALNIKVGEEMVLLRKLHNMGQILLSHGLHLYFMTLSDFFHKKDSREILSKFKKEFDKTLYIRDFGNRISEAIGGRAIHPISPAIGGFYKWPNEYELFQLWQERKDVLKAAISVANIFGKINYPDFFRQTEYLCIGNRKKIGKKEYPIYDGVIISNEGFRAEPASFIEKIREYVEPGSPVKRVTFHDNTVMLGAIARVTNNFEHLNEHAKIFARAADFHEGIFNPFYNILAQAIELVHFTEEIGKILEEYLRMRRKEKNIPYKYIEGKGLGAMEAPRGTLYHFYEIGKNGLVKRVNIIPPTAQFLPNLEQDLKFYLPKVRKRKDRERQILMMIRAYDPCISCAVH